jgi:hypothetical protein
MLRMRSAMAAIVVIFSAIPAMPAAEIRVGVDDGDIRGSDHKALQAAVDYVARQGGGTVHIGGGRYLMRNALILRDNVRIVGVPAKTILAACDGAKVRLAADGDCNERQITVENPAAFRVGDGVSIQDEHVGDGFEVTTATLTGQVDSNTFSISAPLYLDYMVRQKATARLVFPVVGGWNVKNATVEGLTIAGNREHSEPLNGCRGGGIYLFQCEGITIRNCTVGNYNGDGISFQVSQHVTVEKCVCSNNAGLGLHPGSGSQHPIVRNNRSLNNGRDGLFVCWRVKHGLFEGNEVRGNRGSGISIGHKDTDNVFRMNDVIGNGRSGLLFRNELEAMGAHRNVFENNRFLDNGLMHDVKGLKEPIVILGTHHGLVFRKNTIGFTDASASPGVAILTSSDSKGGFEEAGNNFVNIKTKVKEQDQGR